MPRHHTSHTDPVHLERELVEIWRKLDHPRVAPAPESSVVEFVNPEQPNVTEIIALGGGDRRVTGVRIEVTRGDSEANTTLYEHELRFHTTDQGRMIQIHGVEVHYLALEADVHDFFCFMQGANSVVTSLLQDPTFPSPDNRRHYSHQQICQRRGIRFPGHIIMRPDQSSTSGYDPEAYGWNDDFNTPSRDRNSLGYPLVPAAIHALFRDISIRLKGHRKDVSTRSTCLQAYILVEWTPLTRTLWGPRCE